MSCGTIVSMDTILKGLNDKQREAVTAPDGPLLILAGAGSGKTMTLTRRIAYLIKRGEAPTSIVAVTFTNKAADEMRERITQLLGDGVQMPVMGTFHSVCVRFLRRDIHHLGRDRSFTILDNTDQISVIKRIFKDLNIDAKQFAPAAVRAAISRAKNALLTADQFAAHAGSFFEEVVAQIYKEYEKVLAQTNALDFDDLIVFVVRLFEEHPDVLARYHHQFKHILVDEYQDTNHMQYRLITLLAQKHKNLFIIGDDYQSIYMFREADITNILNFEKDYPHAKIITLEQNYRSTQIILDAATAVIHKNENQRHKVLWTENGSGEAITLYAAPSERGEARYVAQMIRKARQDEWHYRDMVVLYRVNAQSRVIEEALMRENIPYRIVGGTKFYERKEIKDIVAYLRVILNGADRVALERIINVPPRGIGAKTFAAWQTFALMHDTDMLSAGLLLQKDGVMDGVSAARKKAIAAFCEMIAKMRDTAQTKTLAQLIADVYITTGYKEMLSRGEDKSENESRHENIGELINIAKEYDGDALTALATFLEQTSLAADTDTIDRDDDAVHLMTLHSAKGLEFPIVFIVGLEEGLLPHARSQLSVKELEEERRLMYVGMTRAMKKLYITHAHQRLVFGSMQANMPSRFLADIPKELYHEDHTHVHDSMYTHHAHKTREQTALNAFADGTAVAHPQFGTGLIVAQDENTYTIAFAGAGIKKIAKSFDGLEQK